MLTATLSFPFGVLLYLFYLVRPETLPLLLICFEMGTLASRAFYSPALFTFLCQTVFFYPGQSSNISSIDIAVGYKGLSSYSAAFVLFQILGNFYATPTALISGYLLRALQITLTIIQILQRRQAVQRGVDVRSSSVGDFTSAICTAVFRYHWND
ncbi:unnamed protein product [Angiostrongylus costaricensis]|uniref:Pecanex-like protein n=1 Tax=Angiostrongylus costaricensis TaxID=334426 RepID=A0A0R3PBG2_ANGCS|nr:unnamed protein product [Angiostrongylus costaricensis]